MGWLYKADFDSTQKLVSYSKSHSQSRTWSFQDTQSNTRLLRCWDLGGRKVHFGLLLHHRRRSDQTFKTKFPKMMWTCRIRLGVEKSSWCFFFGLETHLVPKSYFDWYWHIELIFLVGSCWIGDVDKRRFRFAGIEKTGATSRATRGGKLGGDILGWMLSRDIPKDQANKNKQIYIVDMVIPGFQTRCLAKVLCPKSPSNFHGRSVPFSFISNISTID